MTASIFIKNFCLRCYVGETQEERKELQDIIVNAECQVEIDECLKSDKLEDTWDYRKLHEQASRLAEKTRFCLLENMADALADICLQDTHVLSSRIRLEKPHKLKFTESVGVELTKHKS